MIIDGLKLSTAMGMKKSVGRNGHTTTRNHLAIRLTAANTDCVSCGFFVFSFRQAEKDYNSSLSLVYLQVRRRRLSSPRLRGRLY